MGHTPEGRFRRLDVPDMLKRFESEIEAMNYLGE